MFKQILNKARNISMYYFVESDEFTTTDVRSLQNLSNNSLVPFPASI